MTEVSGSTSIPTALGPLTIGQIAALHPPELNTLLDYNGPKIFMENGFLATPKFFYISKLDTMQEISLINGIKFTARGDQKVLTKKGFVRINALKPRQDIAVVSDFFSYICLTASLTEPVVDITQHAEYMNNNVKWVPIASRRTDETKGPGFNFAIPYYKRFVGNGIICSD